MSVLVVAEKPSVARDIATVLGARGRAEGHFHGAGWVVTWAIGHLVALAEPHEMNPAWKRWRLSDLPLLPSSWPLVVSDSTRDQFAVVRELLRSRDVRGVVCATDAGREGELIFRYIYEAAGSTKPVKRLWISSLTPDAIASGFRALRDGKELDRLADAARARSRADWLVGMNLSRLYSVQNDDQLSVGRVQTPTLAMLVARELEIRSFVPEDYLEVVARFAPPQGEGEHSARDVYAGTWTRPNMRGPEATRLSADGAEAEAILARARSGTAAIASVDRQTRRLPPPQLYDLTELQRHANRLFGFTAERTLKIAQTLYEQRKLLSYPRTDSRHLSRTLEATLPEVVRAIEPLYRGLLAEGTGTRPLGPRFVDDARVTDHHAIIPTTTAPPDALPADERKIYDLVCRRLLAAWHGDHVFAVTTVETTIESGDVVDRYISSGTSVESEGWKVLDLRLSGASAKSAAEPTLPGGLVRGMPRRVLDAKSVAKKTRPPPRFTDGTLLTAMETAGRTLDEKELSRAMRERGLGTPATRAAILETLLRRAYVVRDGKLLAATDKGVALVDAVHPHVKSPAMTGEWEARLARIERGEEELATFMAGIERYVREVVGSAAPRTDDRGEPDGPVATAASTPPARLPARSRERPSEHPGERPADLGVLLKTAFRFPSFRPYQEEVCRAAAAGRDVLLVMPTGAGKSLCYQLPGIARGGTTLVVSPLIALMEDQVAALAARGFAAARIHSGRSRLDSRAACRAYLDGELDFLFIAPERLRVPGFPEMLAKRKPTLIAIDEAHCISQWGHDFRPDYRMLGARLPLLRPAPVIALTATATPTVQDDIVSELALASPARMIHGFRRTNIAVEIVSRAPSERAEVVERLLSDRARLPAIVYAPTRSESEILAKRLSRRLRAAAYHAGLAADARGCVQAAFQGDTLDVVVATIAFGMGIDKPDVRTVVHTALPATLEGYYQEIGRAGRDGGASRAVLLHSYADTKTHEYFLERDYPEVEVLVRVQKKIAAKATATAMKVSELAGRAKLEPDVLDKVLDKLWVHGAAVVSADGSVRLGNASASEWKGAYARQRAHKKEQLAKMRRFAEKPACRMLGLVSHFGDQNDSGLPCGICDVCAPNLSIAHELRAPTEGERDSAARILAALATRDGLAIGQIHRDVLDTKMDRRDLDHVLGALARGSLVRIADDAFEKDGETIVFQRVWLTSGGRNGAPATDLRVSATPAAKKKTRKHRPKPRKRAKGKGRKGRAR